MSVVKNFFNKLLPDAMSENPQTFREIGYQYTFKITGEGGGEWYVNTSKSDSSPLVKPGDLGVFDCHITMTVKDCEECCKKANNFIPLPFSERIEITSNTTAITGMLTGVLKIFRLGKEHQLNNLQF